MRALGNGLCSDCSGSMVDVGDELVCPACGVVREKVVADSAPWPMRPPLGRAPLGSYMGSFDATGRERRTKGITGADGNYQYLKRLSDTAGRGDRSAGECTKLIERVGERLFLPTVALAQASAVARKVIASTPGLRRATAAAVSAFSMITACRIEGVASVSASEIIGAHRALGKRVTSASVMRLALDSPVRAYARGSADYVPMVVGRLSSSPRVGEKLARDRVPPAPYFTKLRGDSLELLRLVGNPATTGKRPCALAGASVYSAEFALAVLEGRRRRLTQRDVAEVSDTAEYTIREQCANLFTPAVSELVARRSHPLPPSPTRRTVLPVLAPQAP